MFYNLCFNKLFGLYDIYTKKLKYNYNLVI